MGSIYELNVEKKESNRIETNKIESKDLIKNINYINYKIIK